MYKDKQLHKLHETDFIITNNKPGIFIKQLFSRETFTRKVDY